MKTEIEEINCLFDEKENPIPICMGLTKRDVINEFTLSEWSELKSKGYHIKKVRLTIEELH